MGYYDFYTIFQYLQETVKSFAVQLETDSLHYGSVGIVGDIVEYTSLLLRLPSAGSTAPKARRLTLGSGSFVSAIHSLARGVSRSITGRQENVRRVWSAKLR